MIRTWYLTLLVIVIPWGTLLFWAPDPACSIEYRIFLVLKWLPSFLVFGLGAVQDRLGLDPEFGLTPALFFAWLSLHT